MASRSQRLDPTVFLPLTPAVLEILLALAEGDKHGYAVMQAVQKCGSAGRLLPGTLYRALARLLDSRLVAETAAPTKERSDDARRRYYRLTRLGRRVLEAEIARLEDRIRTAHLSGLSAASRRTK